MGKMTESKSSKSGISRPFSLGTYAKLMIGTVILIGVNFIFTNLFDQVYGTSDLAAIAVTGILFIALASSFTVYLWFADTHGTIARMLGASREDLAPAVEETRHGRTPSKASF